MSIKRQQNWLGQSRVDVPHLRSVESSIANDFDVLAGKMLSGKVPLVLRGLTLSTNNVIGQPAENLQLNVAGSLIMHYGASEAGTIFSVDDNATPQTLIGTNVQVEGSFTSDAINYIGLDLIRSADASTTDLVQFLDVDTQSEVPEVVPLSRTLQFKIIITTQNFSVSSNILPIAKITTDASNNVTAVTDARQMMFRLGSGGDNPNPLSSYDWGTREENPITLTSGNTSPFIGEDKSINDLKTWMNTIMTSVWEVKGGERWYSAAHPYNVKLAYGFNVSLNDNFEYSAGTLKWENLRFVFENAETANIYYNEINDDLVGVPLAFPADNGKCLYVDLVRESNATGLTLQVGNLWELGWSDIPGRRYIVAWTANDEIYTRDRPYEVGRSFANATTFSYGMVRLSRTSFPVSPAAVVISNGGGTITSNTATALEGLRVYGGGLAGAMGIIAIGEGATYVAPAFLGNGIYAQGGTISSGAGGWFTAGGTGVGVVGEGGPSGGWGGSFSGTINNRGLRAAGNGTAEGVKGVGGVTGYGVIGLAANEVALGTITGTPSKVGVYGGGSVSGEGVLGVGGNAGGTGVAGIASNGTNGVGVRGDGKGTGAGVYGFNDGGTGVAINGVATGTKTAIQADSVNGTAVLGVASGTGTAIRASSSTGYGVYAEGGDAAGVRQTIYAANGSNGQVLLAEGSHDHNGDIAVIRRLTTETSTEPHAVLSIGSTGSQFGIFSSIIDPASGVDAAGVFGWCTPPSGAGYELSAGIIGRGSNRSAGGDFRNFDDEGPAIRVWNGGIRFKSNTLDVNTNEVNTLVADNTPKAWGNIVTDGAGGFDVQNGYNMTASLASGYMLITFNEPMANVDYSVTATAGTNTSGVFVLTNVPIGGFNRTTLGFLIYFYRVTPGPGALDPNANIVFVDFQVFGNQTL